MPCLISHAGTLIHKCSHTHVHVRTWKSTCSGLARTIRIQCIYGIFGRDVIKYTVIYGVYLRFWPNLLTYNYIYTCRAWLEAAATYNVPCAAVSTLDRPTAGCVCDGVRERARVCVGGGGCVCVYLSKYECECVSERRSKMVLQWSNLPSKQGVSNLSLAQTVWATKQHRLSFLQAFLNTICRFEPA